MGESDGLVKVLSDKNTDRMLGAHIIATVNNQNFTVLYKTYNFFPFRELVNLSMRLHWRWNMAHPVKMLLEFVMHIQ